MNRQNTSLRTIFPSLAVALLIATLAACTVAPPSANSTVAAPKLRIEKAADLPTFTYPVQGDLASLVRDDARFKPLSQKIAQDYSGVLAKYEIA